MRLHRSLYFSFWRKLVSHVALLGLIYRDGLAVLAVLAFMLALLHFVLELVALLLLCAVVAEDVHHLFDEILL
jgi:hypothetical protein